MECRLYETQARYSEPIFGNFFSQLNYIGIRHLCAARLLFYRVFLSISIKSNNIPNVQYKHKRNEIILSRLFRCFICWENQFSCYLRRYRFSIVFLCVLWMDVAMRVRRWNFDFQGLLSTGSQLSFA